MWSQSSCECWKRAQWWSWESLRWFLISFVARSLWENSMKAFVCMGEVVCSRAILMYSHDVELVISGDQFALSMMWSRRWVSWKANLKVEVSSWVWIELFQVIEALVCGRCSNGGGESEWEGSVRARSAETSHISLICSGSGSSLRSLVLSWWWEWTWWCWMEKGRESVMEFILQMREASVIWAWDTEVSEPWFEVQIAQTMFTFLFLKERSFLSQHYQTMKTARSFWRTQKNSPNCVWGLFRVTKQKMWGHLAFLMCWQIYFKPAIKNLVALLASWKDWLPCLTVWLTKWSKMWKRSKPPPSTTLHRIPSVLMLGKLRPSSKTSGLHVIFNLSQKWPHQFSHMHDQTHLWRFLGSHLLHIDGQGCKWIVAFAQQNVGKAWNSKRYPLWGMYTQEDHCAWSQFSCNLTCYCWSGCIQQTNQNPCAHHCQKSTHQPTILVNNSKLLSTAHANFPLAATFFQATPTSLLWTRCLPLQMRPPCLCKWKQVVASCCLDHLQGAQKPQPEGA